MGFGEVFAACSPVRPHSSPISSSAGLQSPQLGWESGQQTVFCSTSRFLNLWNFLCIKLRLPEKALAQMVEAVSFWSFSSNRSLLYFFFLFKGGEAVRWVCSKMLSCFRSHLMSIPAVHALQADGQLEERALEISRRHLQSNNYFISG